MRTGGRCRPRGQHRSETFRLGSPRWVDCSFSKRAMEGLEPNNARSGPRCLGREGTAMTRSSRQEEDRWLYLTWAVFSVAGIGMLIGGLLLFLSTIHWVRSAS